MKPKRERCINGHRMTPENTFSTPRPNGYIRRECKRCKVQRDKLRYRLDPIYREYHKQKSRRQYAMKKERARDASRQTAPRDAHDLIG